MAKVKSPEDYPWNLSAPSSLLGVEDACLHTGTAPLALLVSSLPAHTADFGFTSLHNRVSQFLRIKFSLFLYTYTSFGSVSVENPDEYSQEIRNYSSGKRFNIDLEVYTTVVKVGDDSKVKEAGAGFQTI